MIIGGDELQQNALGIDWNLIWQCKRVIPKVKVFLWRLLHKGLPLAVNMHTRLVNFDPMCQRCLQENEYEMHCLFFCNTSRQVWFAGQLGIRVDELPLQIEQTIKQAIENLDEEGWIVFANTMWEIWKERNKAVIEHCAFNPQQVLQRINAVLRTEPVLANVIYRNEGISLQEKYEFNAQAWQVVVDASWQVGGRSGGAYVVFDGGKTHSVGLHYFQTEDPFHAEALTLKEAVEYMYDHVKVPTHMMVQFCTDCSNLVLAINQADTADLPTWRPARTVHNLIMELGNRQAELQHVKRETVGPAHDLANLAKRNAINYRDSHIWYCSNMG
ncbi:hypothetical protein LUZ61_020860 [Rhynchospora tenuis]|uniref:Reverse transcriptase zinc-binding domain-containing protein n=1 Tax=Rhynchospora tenuis TaxID=198213 RepID=A0AAD6EPF8_9POAL|nr:hypothetical protein LUZ61_020860 [Rhynchospora tenuis]